MELGVYIHIPFCVRKCNYCDFVSYPLPERKRIERYFDSLCKEIEICRSYVRGAEISTLYFGGGTPTLLPADYIGGIFGKLSSTFKISDDLEFSVEANPDTLSASKVRRLIEIGVNRLTLGVQSLNDQLLFEMGRTHDSKQAVEAFALAQEAGMKNLGVDLMYGLPGQNRTIWRETLERIQSLCPQHISVYGLTAAENTLWGRKHREGLLKLPEQDECGEMYEDAVQFLEQNAYNQYEISNFSRSGFECRHNLKYWRRKPYIGLGVGACSFINSRRYKNADCLDEYCVNLEGGTLPSVECEKIEGRAAMEEFMFLGLRTASGVDAEEFRKEFGFQIDEIFGAQLERLISSKLLEREGRRIRLTREAYLLGNEVFINFI